MRIVGLMVTAAALAFAQGAMAAPISIAPVTISEELQTRIDEELGAREADYLRDEVTEATTEAMARRGESVSANAPLTLEVTILDAKPNRPTFHQLSTTPGLDMALSRSLGGANLRGVLRTSDGRVVREITHRRYNYSLDEVEAYTTWTEASRAIRRFADKVADAAAEQ